MDFGDPKLPPVHTEIHPTEAFAFEMAAAETQTVLDFIRENALIFSGQEPPTAFYNVRLAVVKGPAKTFSVVNTKHRDQPLVAGLGSESIARGVVDSIQRAIYIFRYYNVLRGSHEELFPPGWLPGG